MSTNNSVTPNVAPCTDLILYRSASEVLRLQAQPVQPLTAVQGNADASTVCQRMANAFQRHSNGLKKLPTDALQSVASFLGYRDQGRLAQVAVFVCNAARDTEQYYINLMAPLHKEAELLSKDPQAAQRLLVALVTSPAIGHPKHWVPVLKVLMGHLTFERSANGIIQTHAKMADLLATAQEPISSEQIYQFCRYAVLNRLPGAIQIVSLPWIGYRVLEQYLRRPQLPSEGINIALKEFLTQRAADLIDVGSNGVNLSENRVLNFHEIVIDPRQWFGLAGEGGSLWFQIGAQNNEGPIPKLVCEVLWRHIQSLRTSCTNRPLLVHLTGRVEVHLPHNFTLPLAQLITSANIYLEHHHTVDTEELANPEYAHAIWALSSEQKQKLAQDYPGAVSNRE